MRYLKETNQAIVEQGHQPGTESHDRAARLAAVEDCKRLVRVKACSDCARFRRTGCVWAAQSLERNRENGE